MRTNKLRPIKKRGGGLKLFFEKKKKYKNKEGAGGKCMKHNFKKNHKF